MLFRKRCVFLAIIIPIILYNDSFQAVNISFNKEQNNVNRTRIIDTSPDSLIIELTGETGKIDAFITMLGDFEILEIARTGITGLGRGIANVTYLD